MSLRIICHSFLVVMIASACDSSVKLSAKKAKRAHAEAARRSVHLEYAASLEPYVDSSGVLMIPGQKLDRWSGRTWVGSSSYDVVPVD